MTDVRDVPYEDVKIFLRANKYAFKNEEDAYKIFSNLLKDRKAIGHTNSIIEWMMAYNLLKNKVNIPNYTIYEINKMSQKDIDQLAKLLTMKGNNTENIKNILRYLHKLDESVNISSNQNLTRAGEEIFNIILSNLENKDINKMDINRYSKAYLEDQKFWKRRLNDIFGLKTDNQNFDYKFAVKFLDNGKSLDENYHEALKKGLKQIVKLLLDNKVVKDLDVENIDKYFQNDIIRDYSFSPGLYDLSKYKYDSYRVFIKNIYNDFIEENDFSYNTKYTGQIKLDYFDEIIYTKDTLLVKLPLLSFNGSDNLSGVPDEKIFTLYSVDGFTTGEILYKMAQEIPNAEDLTIFSDLILKYDDPLKILKELENIRNEIHDSIILDAEVKSNKIIFINEYFIKELNTLINNYEYEEDEQILSNWRHQIDEVIKLHNNGKITKLYDIYDNFLEEILSYNGINHDISPKFFYDFNIH
jgi:hypothetical protein